MKLTNLIIGLAVGGQTINALAIADPNDAALDTRSQFESEPEPIFAERDTTDVSQDLWKRKGGGGGGGRGGGGGGGRPSGGGTRPGGGGGGPTRPAPNSPLNNQGGRTTTGSGPQPNFNPGGGRPAVYPAGAAVPYNSGRNKNTPSGLAPVILTGAALGGIGFLGIAALSSSGHSWNAYRYRNDYQFFNASASERQSKPVTCLCQEETVCACDEGSDRNQILDQLIGDGTYSKLNRSVVDVAPDPDRNGRSTIFVYGGLPNGTTVPGGTDDPNDDGSSAVSLTHAVGLLPVVVAGVVAAFVATM